MKPGRAHAACVSRTALATSDCNKQPGTRRLFLQQRRGCRQRPRMLLLQRAARANPEAQLHRSPCCAALWPALLTLTHRREHASRVQSVPDGHHQHRTGLAAAGLLASCAMLFPRAVAWGAAGLDTICTSPSPHPSTLPTQILAL